MAMRSPGSDEKNVDVHNRTLRMMSMLPEGHEDSSNPSLFGTLNPGSKDGKSGPQPGSPGGKSLWLEAFHDPLASIHAHQACVRTADLFGDGEGRLVVAEPSKRLRVWRGTSMVAEQALVGRPTGIAVFYPDTNAPRVPALAVASGPHVYIYRNLRPYFKFALPNVDLDTQELQAWDDGSAGRAEAPQLTDRLSILRATGVELSARSIHLLSLTTAQSQAEFVLHLKGQPLVQQTVVTCIGSIRKQVDEPDAMSCVVVGSENRKLLILHPNGQSVLWKGALPSTPAFLATFGLLDVDYRIVVACRDANLYTIKNNEVATSVIQMETMPCGVLAVGKNIVVGCMNCALHSFHVKGKKNWTVNLPATILAIELISIERQRNSRAVAVGLSNGEIHIYNENNLVSVTKTNDRVRALQFGKFGREDNTLVSVAKGGALTVRILPRSASLEVGANGVRGPPSEQDIPLNIPKKTKLYVEQTAREREQAVEMHRIFQRDLCKLRLATARAYVKVLTDGQGPISYTAGASLRLNAQVHGLGPLFKIKLSLQNTGARSVSDLSLSASYNPALYYLPKSHLQIPALVPGVLYTQEMGVLCRDANAGADVVKVYVCSGTLSVIPILSAIVRMPLSELPFDL